MHKTEVGVGFCTTVVVTVCAVMVSLVMLSLVMVVTGTVGNSIMECAVLSPVSRNSGKTSVRVVGFPFLPKPR